MQNKSEYVEAALNHNIWHNPLLKAMKNGELQKTHWALICGHHFRYSRQFTRFLAALAAKLDEPADRNLVFHNLFEEAGDGNEDKSHILILQEFITDGFGAEYLNPAHGELSEGLAADYLRLIENSPAACGAAMLAFGCEAAVPQLYGYFVTGLQQLGMSDGELNFFHIHIGCDDGHADELAKIMTKFTTNGTVSHSECMSSVISCLDLRDIYYRKLYDLIVTNDELTESVKYMVEHLPSYETNTQTVMALSSVTDTLYENRVENKGIDFNVRRVPIAATTLDPRLLTIPGMGQTELHRHAHESLFFVLQGNGLVKVGNEEYPVVCNDIVFVPRWIDHQTINSSDDELRILAITDFGMTRHMASGKESTYRQKVAG